jgi:hypothetical protein
LHLSPERAFNLLRPCLDRTVDRRLSCTRIGDVDGIGCPLLLDRALLDLQRRGHTDARQSNANAERGKNPFGEHEIPRYVAAGLDQHFVPKT